MCECPSSERRDFREFTLDSTPLLWEKSNWESEAWSRGEEGPSMPVPAEADITGLLQRAASGDAAAETSLFEFLYEDLKRQARALMRKQRRDHTLQATGLLHEAWMRVARRADVDWKSRGHFFGFASRAMRSVLVDHARSKKRGKRGGGRVRVPLDDLLLPYEDRAGDLLALDEALSRLAALDAEEAAVVEMRFFGGFTAPETAHALGFSLRKVERLWEHARAWLRRELDP